MFNKIAELVRQNIEFAICTIVSIDGSSPGKSGFRMIVFPDSSIEGTVGGGNLEKLIIKKAVENIKKNITSFEEFTLSDVNMTCGGKTSVYIEVIKRKSRIVIAGAGHIGKELLRIVNETRDFDIIAFDNRKDRVESLSNEYKVEYLEDFIGLENCIEEGDYVVVLTHGHAFDMQALLYVSKGKKTSYVGCIGSKSKVAKLKSDLLEHGVSQNFINTIFTPIGVKLGGDSPFEIAISILAEIIAVKNTGKSVCPMKD
ncbi:MAG: XdhC family protein [Candidatus Muirbacterium halophilum]|nr:XdhC family protein [Candidatus Muirbacterium halophilum]MCK9474382.1 XdhC family protein [Candidatus Muirbacterium halophilum]